LYCSFCGQSKEEVKILIAGPTVFICDECVEQCITIVKERPSVWNRISKKHFISPSNDENIFKKLGLHPRFKTARIGRKENHCFYACPFCEPFTTIYSDHCKQAAIDSGFTIERADEIFGTDPIIEDIWQGINAAEVVIADVTGRNANVMYEIGIAHTVGRPVVMLTQDINDVPFDLKQYRCIIYSHTPRGCKELEDKLSGTLRFLKGKSG
jgi:hypothetical protein